MAEWLKAAVLKTVIPSDRNRGFESLSLLHSLTIILSSLCLQNPLPSKISVTFSRDALKCLSSFARQEDKAVKLVNELVEEALDI